jgi:UDP-2,3-diacylglucosamine pyrophosphatase LpxH
MFDESLLILSDVHLGNDLNDLRPNGVRRSASVDADLVSLLRHYRAAPRGGRRWRLVIAGDFIDFIGMAILPQDGEFSTAPSDEERAHGLGNTSDHAMAKLRAVVARHRTVFDAIGEFLADGHALTLIHGNHDVEFHWVGVQDQLRALLSDIARQTRAADAPFAAEVASRIDFAPWFYYVGGVAYIEHGHQYDTLCSTEHVMAPLAPGDPRQLARSFSDILLRWVVRPTRGVPEYGHEHMGLLSYVVLGLRLGVGGVVHLLARFLGAVAEMLRLRRAYVSQTGHLVREEQERKMAALAIAMRVGIERLRALAALQVPPVTQSVSKILAGVLLDRLGLALACGAAIVTLGAAAPRHTWSWALVAAIAVGWTLVHRRLSARRREWFGDKLDNDEKLVERAGHLARLFPAAFVVMGHTHTPVQVPVADGATTYINVGSWHEAESKDAIPMYRAARTHLVIHPAVAGLEAEFRAWRAGGVVKWSPAAVTRET